MPRTTQTCLNIFGDTPDALMTSGRDLHNASSSWRLKTANENGLGSSSESGGLQPGRCEDNEAVTVIVVVLEGADWLSVTPYRNVNQQYADCACPSQTSLGTILAPKIDRLWITDRLVTRQRSLETATGAGISGSTLARKVGNRKGESPGGDKCRC